MHKGDKKVKITLIYFEDRQKESNNLYIKPALQIISNRTCLLTHHNLRASLLPKHPQLPSYASMSLLNNGISPLDPCMQLFAKIFLFETFVISTNILIIHSFIPSKGHSLSSLQMARPLPPPQTRWRFHHHPRILLPLHSPLLICPIFLQGPSPSSHISCFLALLGCRAARPIGQL